MSGLYNGLISDNVNENEVLSYIQLSKDDIPRYRDVDIPPYKRYRQLPLFTDFRFKDEEMCIDKESVVVLARLGGGNRHLYKAEWEQIRKHPRYVCDYDADFDSTYAFMSFKVSEDELSNLKKIDMNENADIEKMTNTNMDMARRLSSILGAGDVSEIRERAREMALDMLKR